MNEIIETCVQQHRFLITSSLARRSVLGSQKDIKWVCSSVEMYTATRDRTLSEFPLNPTLSVSESHIRTDYLKMEDDSSMDSYDSSTEHEDEDEDLAKEPPVMPDHESSYDGFPDDFELPLPDPD